VQITYHDGTIAIAERIAEDVQRTLRASSRTLEELYRLLDYEYAFHQYYLRRIHGWDGLTLRRGMERAEYKAAFRRGQLRPNAVASFGGREWVPADLSRRGTGAADAYSLKAFWQGEIYLIPSEYEYIVIGGTYRARRIGR